MLGTWFKSSGQSLQDERHRDLLGRLKACVLVRGGEGVSVVYTPAPGSLCQHTCPVPLPQSHPCHLLGVARSLLSSPSIGLEKLPPRRLLPNPSCPKGSCCQGNPPRAISVLRDWSLPPRGLVDISSASQLSSRGGQLPLRENEDSEVRDLHEKTVLSSPS